MTCPPKERSFLPDPYTRLRSSMYVSSGDFWYRVLNESSRPLARSLARLAEASPLATLLESAPAWLADNGAPVVTNLPVDVNPNDIVTVGLDLQARIVSPGTDGSVYVVRFSPDAGAGGRRAAPGAPEPSVDGEFVVVPVSPDSTDAWYIPASNRQTVWLVPLPAGITPLSIRVGSRDWIAGIDFDNYPGAILCRHAPDHLVTRGRTMMLTAARVSRKCVFSYPARSDVASGTGKHVMSYLRDKTTSGGLLKALAEVAGMTVLEQAGVLREVVVLSAGADYVFDYGRVSVPYIHTALEVGTEYPAGLVVGESLQVRARGARRDSSLLQRFTMRVANHGSADGDYAGTGLPHAGRTVVYLCGETGWTAVFDPEDGWFMTDANGEFNVTPPEPCRRDTEHPWLVEWPDGVTVTMTGSSEVYGKWWQAVDWGAGLLLDDICPVKGVVVPNRPVGVEAWDVNEETGKFHLRPYLVFPDNDTRDAYWLMTRDAELRTNRWLNDRVGIQQAGDTTRINMLDLMFEQVLGNRAVVVDIDTVALGDVVSSRVLAFLRDEKPVGAVVIVRTSVQAEADPEDLAYPPGPPVYTTSREMDGITVVHDEDGNPVLVQLSDPWSPWLLTSESDSDTLLVGPGFFVLGG
jgi:hypothetical protein